MEGLFQDTTAGADCCLLWLGLHGSSEWSVHSAARQEGLLEVLVVGSCGITAEGREQVGDQLQCRFPVRAGRRGDALAKAVAQLRLLVPESFP